MVFAVAPLTIGPNPKAITPNPANVTVRAAAVHDQSPPLEALLQAGAASEGGAGQSVPTSGREYSQEKSAAPVAPPEITTPPGADAVEQRSQGELPPAAMIASFDGLGVGFDGPHGSPLVRNPSDNSLAVGRDHIVQTVNSRMAIFTKRGKRFKQTGKVLYGAVATNNVFRGFGSACGDINNGDAVVRYDQLANRWLIVMPIFRRSASRPDRNRSLWRHTINCAMGSSRTACLSEAQTGGLMHRGTRSCRG